MHAFFVNDTEIYILVNKYIFFMGEEKQYLMNHGRLLE